MVDGEKVTGDNVVPLHSKKETGQASEKKWGRGVMAPGFSIVPSLLLRHNGVWASVRRSSRS